MPPHIENNSTAPIMSGLQTVQMSVGCPYCTKNVQLSVIVHHPEDVKKEVTDNSTLIALRPPDKNEPSSNKLSQKDDNSLPVNNKSEPVQVPQIPIETGRVNVGPRLSESISSVVPQQPGMLLEEVPLSVVYSDTDADNNTNSAFKNEAQEMDSIVIKDEPQDDFPFQPSIPEEHFQSNLSQKSMLQHAVPEPIPRSSMRPLSITKTAGMRRPKPYMRKHKRPVSATQTISDIANAGQSQPLMSSLEFQGEPQFSDNQFEIHPDNPMTMTFHGSESMQQFGSEESSASGYNEQFQQNIEGDAATGFGDEDAGSDSNEDVQQHGKNDSDFLDADADDVIAKHKDENFTVRKTRLDLAFFKKEILVKQNESRPLCIIPEDELDKVMSLFVDDVKKVDGSEFEPASIKGLIASVFRYLRQKRYTACEDIRYKFPLTRKSILKKVENLKSLGLGRKPNRRKPLGPATFEILFEKNIIGLDSAPKLLVLLVLNNTYYFDLRGRFSHYDLLWGDIEIGEVLCLDGRMKKRLFLTMRATKRRSDEDVERIRPHTPSVGEIEGSLMCPVRAYEIYRNARPTSLNNDPFKAFYLQPVVKPFEADNLMRFSDQHIGKNKLGAIISSICKIGDIDSDAAFQHAVLSTSVPLEVQNF